MVGIAIATRTFFAHMNFPFTTGLSAYWILAITPAITNTIFNKLKGIRLAKRSGKEALALGTLEAFVLGGIARSVATTLMFPFLRAKTLLQASSKNPTLKDATAIDIVKGLFAKGFLSMYKGLPLSLLRGVVSSAVGLTMKERIYVSTRRVFLAMAIQNAKAAS